MENEIYYNKYEQMGAYHWSRSSINPFKMSPYLRARYLVALKLLKEKLGSLKNKKILDIGCGDGAFTNWLNRQGAKAYGIDSNDLAISLAKEKVFNRSDIEFRIQSGYETGFKNNEFDAVVCLEVLEHVGDPDALLDEIARILKISGCALISTPIRYSLYPIDNLHLREYFEEEFQSFFSSYNTSFYKSHPFFLHDVMKLLTHFFPFIAKPFVNIMSLIYNPYCSDKMHSLIQYAIIKKM